jgi:hypothetical protein
MSWLSAYCIATAALTAIMAERKKLYKHQSVNISDGTSIKKELQRTILGSRPREIT